MCENRWGGETRPISFDLAMRQIRKTVRASAELECQAAVTDKLARKIVRELTWGLRFIEPCVTRELCRRRETVLLRPVDFGLGKAGQVTSSACRKKPA